MSSVKICTLNVICENVVFVLCNNYHGLNIPYRLTSLNRKLTGLAFLSMIAIKIFIHHAPWSIIQYEPLVLDKYPLPWAGFNEYLTMNNGQRPAQSIDKGFLLHQFYWKWSLCSKNHHMIEYIEKHREEI
jgi:hypothetical protein